jgi:hypothetical protein
MTNARTDGLSAVGDQLLVDLLIARADLERQTEILRQRVADLTRRNAEFLGLCDEKTAEDEVSSPCTLTHGCLYGRGHESECATLDAEILDERQTALPFLRERRSS